MYDEYEELTWWQKHSSDVYGACAVVVIGLLLFALMASNINASPATVQIINAEVTNKLAAAKCGEYEMEWLQYHDVGTVYSGRARNQEAIVYCINRETNVTIRDYIPLITTDAETEQ